MVTRSVYFCQRRSRAVSKRLIPLWLESWPLSCSPKHWTTDETTPCPCSRLHGPYPLCVPHDSWDFKESCRVAIQTTRHNFGIWRLSVRHEFGGGKTGRRKSPGDHL